MSCLSTLLGYHSPDFWLSKQGEHGLFPSHWYWLYTMKELEGSWEQIFSYLFILCLGTLMSTKCIHSSKENAMNWVSSSVYVSDILILPEIGFPLLWIDPPMSYLALEEFSSLLAFLSNTELEDALLRGPRFPLIYKLFAWGFIYELPFRKIMHSCTKLFNHIIVYKYTQTVFLKFIRAHWRLFPGCMLN